MEPDDQHGLYEELSHTISRTPISHGWKKGDLANKYTGLLTINISATPIHLECNMPSEENSKYRDNSA